MEALLRRSWNDIRENSRAERCGRRLAVVLVPLACTLPAPPAQARQATTSVVSVDSSGNFGDSPSFSPSISDDGRYVAFSSVASNLIPVDNNFLPDVFVHDRVTLQTMRVSVDSTGAQGNGISWFPAISGDGRFVAFSSLADNLVAGDTNVALDVFVRDLLTNQTTRVSVEPAGVAGRREPGDAADLADGRFVAFDERRHEPRRRATRTASRTSSCTTARRGTTERVSVDSGGSAGRRRQLSTPSISADGRYVAFTSCADEPRRGRHERRTGHLRARPHERDDRARRASTRPAAQGELRQLRTPSISADGRFVAFESSASNLVAGDTNGSERRLRARPPDRRRPTRVSVDLGRARRATATRASCPSISADGRFVAFAERRDEPRRRATRTAPTTSSCATARRDDRARERGRRAGREGEQLGAGSSSISADGRVRGVRERSLSNLVPGDTNGAQDVFVRDRGRHAARSPFCFGDGTGHGLPVRQREHAGQRQGCRHSLGTGGATSCASGLASLSADTFVLGGSRMPNSSALYFQGTTVTAGGAGTSSATACAAPAGASSDWARSRTWAARRSTRPAAIRRSRCAAA